MLPDWLNQNCGLFFLKVSLPFIYSPSRIICLLCLLLERPRLLKSWPRNVISKAQENSILFSFDKEPFYKIADLYSSIVTATVVCIWDHMAGFQSDVLAVLTNFQMKSWNKWYIIEKPYYAATVSPWVTRPKGARTPQIHVFFGVQNFSR